MTLASRDKFGIPAQRGFWLRCFLGFSWTVLCLVTASLSWAKVQPQGALHLWRLHGFYMDAKGTPIQNAELTLQRDGTVLHSAKSDGSGRFAFDHVRGRYTLHIDKSSNYSQLSREVIVGLETAMMLRGTTLYIVAGPGACTDDCASIFTSKGEFERTIRRNTEHHR